MQWTIYRKIVSLPVIFLVKFLAELLPRIPQLAIQSTDHDPAVEIYSSVFVQTVQKPFSWFRMLVTW